MKNLRMKIKLCGRSKDIITNEKGAAADIAVFAVFIGLCVSLVAFAMFVGEYLASYRVMTTVSDSILKDSMQVNNGLTPVMESYVLDELERRGFERSKIKIQATPSAVPFGTEMEASIEYSYEHPIVRLTEMLYPDIEIGNITIRTSFKTYALGVVR